MARSKAPADAAPALGPPWEGRVRRINEAPPRPGKYVLYWMQQSQRASGNLALDFAVQTANDLGLPVLVVFGLMDGYPDANHRHYRFMLEGLAETAVALEAAGIPFVLGRGSPPKVALSFAADAAALVCDAGHLHHQRSWRWTVSVEAPCPVFLVDADVVVPVRVASSKAEVAARTLRPKIHKLLPIHLVASPPVAPAHSMTRRQRAGLRPSDLGLGDLDAALARLDVDRSVPPVSEFFPGGQRAARERLQAFLDEGLRDYAARRRRPEAERASHLSMYLHFGQISAIEVAKRVLAQRTAAAADRDAFLEELIVRRELAHNFVAFTRGYDRFSSVPAWAQATLASSRWQRRTLVAPAAIEAGRTPDRAFNAAMQEMRHTGYLHNAMRMYWGKKILEWTADPADAFALVLALNNRYFLDGRDANSYANVGWVFGLHDRPFGPRPGFGTVRSMTAAGLERKSDVAAFLDSSREKVARARAAGIRLSDPG